MLRRTLVAAGCAAGLAWGVAVGWEAGPAAAHAADAPCRDATDVAAALDVDTTWSTAGTKGIGVKIGVVGAPDRVTEAVCAVRVLAPEATVTALTPDQAATAGSAFAVIVAADTSVNPGTVRGTALVVAAAGDTGGPMATQLPGIVYVAATDLSGARRPTSSSGPAMTLAAYGPDTSTAAGYVAALAALVRIEHPDWRPQLVVAQMAGATRPGALHHPHTDDIGYGRIKPVPTVDRDLNLALPATLDGFEQWFPANAPSQPASSAPTAQVPSSASGAGTPLVPTASASDGAGATTAPSAAGSGPPPVIDTTDTAQQWPTGDPLTPIGGGPTNLANTAAGKKDGGGGINPVLLFGLLLLLGGGGYLAWQRWRRPPAPATPVKPESEWEAPSGPRHSGYSPPEE